MCINLLGMEKQSRQKEKNSQTSGYIICGTCCVHQSTAAMYINLSKPSFAGGIYGNPKFKSYTTKSSWCAAAPPTDQVGPSILHSIAGGHHKNRKKEMKFKSFWDGASIDTQDNHYIMIFYLYQWLKKHGDFQISMVLL